VLEIASGHSEVSGHITIGPVRPVHQGFSHQCDVDSNFCSIFLVQCASYFVEIHRVFVRSENLGVGMGPRDNGT